MRAAVRRFSGVFLLAALVGCRGASPAAAPDAAVMTPAAQAPPAPAPSPATPRFPEMPCPVEDAADVDDILDEAAKRFELGDYPFALACAERAVRLAPRSVEAHHDRADALAALGRLDEAKQAFVFALALDPDDPHTLASAADLYLNRLPPDRDASLIALEYARRGSQHVGLRREDKPLGGRLALLEAQALDDLGRSDEALTRVDAALAAAPDNADARFTRALVLFHLCRLSEAKAAFETFLADEPDDAFAHHHLGLLLEREGQEAEAARHFARARALAPDDFPAPVELSTAAFRELVATAVAELEPSTRDKLRGVAVEVAELPDDADLRAVEPPFPPTILGLFRGPSLDEPAVAPRTIVLYRKNLLRAVTSQAELERQVRVTLHHEIGHLFGADEDDLRARGLE